MQISNQTQNISSEPPPSETGRLSSERYLNFLIDNQRYAVRSSEVLEIILMKPVTYMPALPPSVRGVINLRGKIIPVIDLRLKLRKHSAGYDDRTCIIVSDVKAYTVGLIVDTVKDVTSIEKDQITSAAALALNAADPAVFGIATVNGHPVMLLDILRILNDTTDEGEASALDNTVMLSETGGDLSDI